MRSSPHCEYDLWTYFLGVELNGENIVQVAVISSNFHEPEVSEQYQLVQFAHFQAEKHKSNKKNEIKQQLSAAYSPLPSILEIDELISPKIPMQADSQSRSG